MQPTTQAALSTQLLVLRYTWIVALAGAIVTLVYTLLSAPTRQVSRYGLRGLKRQRALANNDLWATVEPLVRWLGVRVSGIPTEEQRAELDKQIGLAGDFMGITADEYIALSILSAVGGGIVGLFGGFVLDLGNIAVIAGLVLGLGAIQDFATPDSGEQKFVAQRFNRAFDHHIRYRRLRHDHRE